MCRAVCEIDAFIVLFFLLTALQFVPGKKNCHVVSTQIRLYGEHRYILAYLLNFVIYVNCTFTAVS